MAAPISQESDRLFLVPNMIEDHVGTKAEKEQKILSEKKLKTLGKLIPRIKRSVTIQRCSTLSVTSAQIKSTADSWKAVINKLNKLKLDPEESEKILQLFLEAIEPRTYKNGVRPSVEAN